MSLPLFRIRRTGSTGYDEARGFVVAAESEAQARALLSAPRDADGDEGGVDTMYNNLHAGDEGRSAWANTSKSTCEQISSTSIFTEPEVVLRDFRHG